MQARELRRRVFFSGEVSFVYTYVKVSLACLLLSGCAPSTFALPSSGVAHLGNLSVQDLKAIGDSGSRGRSASAASGSDTASWVLPEASSEDLLYVSSHNWVSIYSYPQGRLVGKLKGFLLPSGQCVDGSSNVYITDYDTNRVSEYVHGDSRRLRTLRSFGANSCSVDPTTGNLAVAAIGDGGVSVFQNAKGRPTIYKNANFYGYYGCAYDAKGNLFINGMTRPGTGNFIFAELPKGGSALKVVQLNQYIGYPSAMQWDGKHLAVGDQATPAIYQFVVAGSTGTKVGTTSLGSNASDTLQFWIQGQTVITSTVCTKPHGCGPKRHGRGSAVMLFDYPAGGPATKIITAAIVGEPQGDSVSLAPGKR